MVYLGGGSTTGVAGGVVGMAGGVVGVVVGAAKRQLPWPEAMWPG